LTSGWINSVQYSRRKGWRLRPKRSRSSFLDRGVPNGGCSIVLLHRVGQGRTVLPLVAPLCIGDHFPILGWELHLIQSAAKCTFGIPTARQRIGAFFVVWLLEQSNLPGAKFVFCQESVAKQLNVLMIWVWSYLAAEISPSFWGIRQ
jgi:hypothetical protein